ncbi:MAG: hypothetical protein JWO24_2957, partial [Rhodospirillales bacterium]|nr:hypothetical protein [Rhodospirillales bacterium]
MLPGPDGTAVETIEPTYKKRHDAPLSADFDMTLRYAIPDEVWMHSPKTRRDRALISL